MRVISFPLSVGLFLSTLTLFSAFPGRASASSPPASAEARFQLCSYTLDHVYFYTSTGAVDVTDTLYTSQGQTYAVYQGSPVAISLNYDNGNVYNMQHNVVGFIWLVNSGPGSGNPHLAKGRAAKSSLRTLRYTPPARVPASRKERTKAANRHLLVSVPVRSVTSV